MNQAAQDKLRVFRERLAVLEPYPWDQMAAWIASATPLIKSQYRKHFQEFKAVTVTPSWCNLPKSSTAGRYGNPSLDNFAPAATVEEQENRKLAASGQKTIISFLDGLLDLETLPVPTTLSGSSPATVHQYYGPVHSATISRSTLGSFVAGDHGAATNEASVAVAAPLYEDYTADAQPSRKASAVKARDPETVQQVVPIYRDFRYADWFATMAEALRRHSPVLGAEMLYYGPGLEMNWLKLESGAGAALSVRRTFRDYVLPMIDALHLMNGVTVVDLGIGDFKKGRTVLEHFLASRTVGRVSYCGVDISYEMLARGLSTIVSGELLAQLLGTSGRVLGVNTDFLNIGRYMHLFSKVDSNLFLLLGNTLGNEPDEVALLRSIRTAMAQTDFLIIEAQLIEETPIPDEELTALFQAEDVLRFCLGPFQALGCPLDSMELIVASDDSETRMRGFEARTYRDICRLKRTVVLEHAALPEGKLEVGPADVCMQVVRKYAPGSVEKIVSMAGLKVIAANIAPTNDKGRRYVYVAAQTPH